jgi:serine/threonine-protein kinase
MSPEQARGQPVDKRADVWAFGCVLYEMLTSRAPFARETVSDSMAAILERDPDWTRLPRAIAPELPRLLARCLAKDRQQRLRDIGDARLEIDEALASPSATASAVRSSKSSTSRWLAAILASTVATALVTWIVLSPYSRSQPSPFPVRFTIAAPPGYEVDLNRSPVGVSRDGRTVAFAASQGSAQRIYLRDLDKIDATPLPGTEGGFAPFFSPDGQWIGFFANQKLRKVSRAGGASVSIADVSEFAGNRSVAASWDEQDDIFFTPDVTKGIWRISSAGGTPVAVTTPMAGESFHIWPQLLPGGKALLFSAVGDGPDPQAFVQRLDTGERKPLLRGLGARYVPTGHLLFMQGGSLMAVRFDLARLEITGPAVAVATDIAEPFRLRITPNGFSPLFDVSPTGTVAFLSADRPRQDALVWVDRSGRETSVGVGASGGTYVQPRLSPDGRRIAVVVRGDDHDDVWLYDLGRNTWGRVTTEGNNGFPIWTRDGSRLVYSSDRTGTVSIESTQLDGGGVSELLVRSERATRAFPFSWSPDGVLAFVSNRGTQNVWLLRPRQEATPFFTTPFIEGAPMFAPDGHAIAYVSNETGRNEINIRPFPGPGEKLHITNEGGNEPLWMPNGRELIYRNGDAVMAVDVTTSPTLKAGTPRKLFEKHYESTLALFANYSISPDSQRFVMVKRISEGGSPTEIKVAFNWFDELKTRMTAK